MNTLKQAVLWQGWTPAQLDSKISRPVHPLLNSNQIQGAAKPTADQAVCMIAHPEDLSHPRMNEAFGFYIPGAYCRQGDVLEAVRQTKKPVWIERGAFLSPKDMSHIVSRFGGGIPLTIVEAGSHLGYEDRVLDLRSVCLYKSWGVRVSLSLSDLMYPSAHASAYRPSWEDEPVLQESYLKFLTDLSHTHDLGLVIKAPTHPDETKNEQNTRRILNALLAETQLGD